MKIRGVSNFHATLFAYRMCWPYRTKTTKQFSPTRIRRNHG